MRTEDLVELSRRRLINFKTLAEIIGWHPSKLGSIKSRMTRLTVENNEKIQKAIIDYIIRILHVSKINPQWLKNVLEHEAEIWKKEKIEPLGYIKDGKSITPVFHREDIYEDRKRNKNEATPQFLDAQDLLQLRGSKKFQKTKRGEKYYSNLMSPRS